MRIYLHEHLQVLGTLFLIFYSKGFISLLWNKYFEYFLLSYFIGLEPVLLRGGFI